jgi:hypothetical protein
MTVDVAMRMQVRPLMDHEKGCEDIVKIMPPGKVNHGISVLESKQ